MLEQTIIEVELGAWFKLGEDKSWKTRYRTGGSNHPGIMFPRRPSPALEF